MEQLSQKDDKETTRGHELYLSYLLLLLQAAPLALKGYIFRKVRDCNGNLADLIKENKDTFDKSYRDEFEQLFLDYRINHNIDSWDVRLRCVVILVLFHSELESLEAKRKAIECILDQMKDLDNYVRSVSLDYKTFKTKSKSLHNAILELINVIGEESKFECNRMIHSYQPGSISISQEDIRNLKSTNDVKKHVEIALQNKHDTEYGKEGSYDLESIKFNETLQDKFISTGDSVILTCKLNTSDKAVKWRHDNTQIEKSETLKIIKDENCHWLAISCARLEDAGQYSCACCKASTTAYLRVSDKPPLKIDKELHVATEKSNIREHMDIYLVCEVNQHTTNVMWRHNDEMIDCKRHIIALNGNVHTLAILQAQYEDEGEYTVDFGDTISSTTVMLKDKPSSLTFTEELHVATEETNVRENMDIILVCKVNLLTAKVTWRHNGNVIHCNRHIVTLNGNDHTLTILQAQYEDEGEYTVDFDNAKSSTEVLLKGHINFCHRAQFSRDLYKNWVRGALGLKYLKLGLEDVSRTIVEMHHSDLRPQLSCIGNLCTQCTKRQSIPAHNQCSSPNTKCICKDLRKRNICPKSGIYCKFFDEIRKKHRFKDPLLDNTDVRSWENDPWSIATCFINSSGYRGKLSEKEIDCAGLLSLFINNTSFEIRLNKVEVNGKTDVFKRARDTRNAILHNANYELSEGQLNNYLDIFISVLEAEDVNGQPVLLGYSGTREAKESLNELRNNKIDISIAGELEKWIQKMKDHALTEEAKKIEEATKQHRMKQQLLEERLTERENELQLMRDLRSSKPKENDTTVVFNIDLHLQVIEQTGKTSTQGNDRIFKIMKDYQNGQKKKANLHTPSTESNVQRLLEQIEIIENCIIVDISYSQTTTVVKASCSTCEAIDRFLKLINGNQFQKEMMDLRKCLKMQEHLNIYDVIASCSPASLENTRKSLSKRAQMKNFTCEKHNGTQCTWYCYDHVEFFCTACKDLYHRTCICFKQVISGRSYMGRSVDLEGKIGDYNVRKKNRLTDRIHNENNDCDFTSRYRSDNIDFECDITSIRMLPNDEILLVDRNNRRLKKLDRTYNIVSFCDIPYTQWDVCYIGNDMAAVSLKSNGIQLVNVSDKLKLVRKEKLEHNCISLACHGETLYIGDQNTIYRYNTDCRHKHVLYTCQRDNNPAMINHIAVSDNGEIIYITDDVSNSLITIGKEGKHLSTLTISSSLMDVCVVDGGTVLVADSSGNGFQVDCEGKKVLGTVFSSASGLRGLQSFCFDMLNCRLHVALKNKSYITVLKLKTLGNF